MHWSRYRFRSRWTLPAPPATVYDVLERVEDYPRWWPQVREVNRIDDTTGRITIRSVLPYDIAFTAREVRRDRGAGVLEIAMSGDIGGRARWTITPHADGSLACYDQVTDVNRTLLRRFAVPGRPLFRVNHRLMMRAGRRGLLAYLAGGRQAV